MKKTDITTNVILLVLDYFMVCLAGFAAYYLRFDEVITVIKPVVYEFPLQDFLYVIFGSAFVFVGVFAWLDLYETRTNRQLRRQIRQVFLGCTVVIMVAIILVFFDRDLFSSRFIILLSWIFSIIFVSSGRILVRIVQYFLFRQGIAVSNLVIVGSGASADTILDRIKNDSTFGYSLAKHFKGTNHDLLSKFQDLIKDRVVDEVIQADPQAPKKDTLHLMEFCGERGIIFRYAADLFNTQSRNVDVDTISGIPVIEIKRTPLDGWGRVLKRVFDIVGSFFLILMTAPVMIITAIAVRIDSRGPILFSRLPDNSKVMRVGKHGTFFHYFKFRSMQSDAHKLRTDPEFLKKVKDLREGTPLMKFDNDPRITRVGLFIRRFSIDEFPEFILVFLGRMSLVGPRPHLPEEVERYKKHHRKALTIKPGITGLAQTSGRSDLSFEDEIRLDTYYIENWSLWLDLWLIVKTPLAMVKKRKAL